MGLAGPHRPRLHRPLLVPPAVRRGVVPLRLGEESDPYRRLAYTWHTFTPDWAARHGFDEAAAAAWRAEPRSRVAFDIEETTAGVVKLTMVQDDFEPGSEVLKGVTNGWPAVIAGLKRLLETGVGHAGRLSGGLPPAVPGQHAPGRPQGSPVGDTPLHAGRLRRRILSILLRSEGS